MISVVNRSVFKKSIKLPYYFAKRYESLELHYDLSEDLTVTHYGKVLILGINLPDFSNSLNDSVLIKLNEKLKDFNVNDKYSVAVLHGIGGNFCTGIQKCASIEKAEELLKTINDLKKPSIANLTGNTKFYGFQLGIMCDIRIMESNALLGLGYKKERGYLFPVARERLLKITGLGIALGIALSNSPLKQTECFASGLCNKCTESGSGLGSSINFAASIAKFPLEEIIEERSLIYSLANGKMQKTNA